MCVSLVLLCVEYLRSIENRSKRESERERALWYNASLLYVVLLQSELSWPINSACFVCVTCVLLKNTLLRALCVCLAAPYAYYG